SDLAALEGTLTDSLDPDFMSGQLQDRVLPFVEAVNTAFSNAVQNVDGTTQAVLEALADGSDLHGVFPVDLYYGSGGALDNFRTALNKDAAKLHDSAVKRLAKTAALVEKKSSLAVVLELRLPSFERAESVDQADVTSLEDAARLDLVICVSAL